MLDRENGIYRVSRHTVGVYGLERWRLIRHGDP